MTPTQEGLPALATDAEIAELWQIVAEVEVDTDIGVPSSLIAGFLARLATAERRQKELQSVADLALCILIKFEPPDSRAVSDEFVAMADIACGGSIAPASFTIVERALARAAKSHDN